MKYPSYLVHYNQNHSAKNGQFISGDGDGDGITNDHKNQKKTSSTSKKKGLSTGTKVAIGVGAGVATAGAVATAGIISAAVIAGKNFYNEYGDMLVDTANLINYSFLKDYVDNYSSQRGY